MDIDAVKIRVKYDTLEQDLAIVRGVRAAGGDGFTIGVDANQGWPVSLFRPNPEWDLERATAFALGCDELGIAWLEEPLDMHIQIFFIGLLALSLFTAWQLTRWWHALDSRTVKSSVYEL